MIDRLDITDEYSVKCDYILNTVIFIDAALIFYFKKAPGALLAVSGLFPIFFKTLLIRSTMFE